MSNIKIIGANVPNMPWQDRPEGSGNLPVWRYNENPIIGRNPAKELRESLIVQLCLTKIHLSECSEGSRRTGFHIFILEEARMRFTGNLRRIRFRLKTRMEMIYAEICI